MYLKFQPNPTNGSRNISILSRRVFFVQQYLYYVTWTVEAKYYTDSTEALCGNTEKGGKKEHLCAVVVNGWLSHNTGWRATPKMTLKNECFAEKQVLNMSKSEIF